jgi:hypothetical protein
MIELANYIGKVIILNRTSSGGDWEVPKGEKSALHPADSSAL